jgi:hypothetical protein
MTYEQEKQLVKDTLSNFENAKKIIYCISDLSLIDAFSALSAAKEVLSDVFNKKVKDLQQSLRVGDVENIDMRIMQSKTAVKEWGSTN